MSTTEPPPPDQSGGIFLNYRQRGNALLVAALHERLARHFGADRVFFDTRSIDPGKRYPDILRDRLGAATVLVAVIHPAWVTDLGPPPTDWVRKEISDALRQGMSVLPLLLDDTPLPTPDELAGIEELGLRQVCRIRWRTFEADFAQLIRTLELLVSPTWAPPNDAESPAARPSALSWPATLTAVSGLAGLALPTIVLVGTGAPDTGSVFTAALAVVSAFFMLLALPAVALSRVVSNLLFPTFRRLEIDEGSRRMFGLTLMIGPLVVLLVLYALPLAIRQTPSSGLVVSMVMVFVLAFVGVAAVVVRGGGPDRLAWPPAHPVTANEVSLRQGLVMLNRTLAGRPAVLTRELYDQVNWLRHELRRRLDEAERLAGRGCRDWALDDHRPKLAGLAVWACLTVGLAIGAAVAWPVSGPRWWHLLPLAAAGFCVVVPLATVRIAYRGQRARLRTVLADIRTGLVEADELMPRSAEPPLAWLVTPGNTTRVRRGEIVHLGGAASPDTRIEFVFSDDRGHEVVRVSTTPATWGRLVCPEDNPFDTAALPPGRITVVASIPEVGSGDTIHREVADLVVT